MKAGFWLTSLSDPQGELRCARATRPTPGCFLSPGPWKRQEQTSLGQARNGLPLQEPARDIGEGSGAPREERPQRLKGQIPVRERIFETAAVEGSRLVRQTGLGRVFPPASVLKAAPPQPQGLEPATGTLSVSRPAPQERRLGKQASG